MRFVLTLPVVALLACGSPSTPAGKCNPNNCAAGCCDGDTCVDFASQNDAFCGSAGAACNGCGGNSCQMGQCVARNQCSTNNGGCDANATCSQPGIDVQCACGTGFGGDGVSCQPLLSALSLSAGYLSPAFDPSRTAYVAVLPAGTASVTVTAATMAAPTELRIDGVAGASRTVTVSASSQVVRVEAVATNTRDKRTYTVALEQASTTISQRAYLKPSRTLASMGFGRSVAVSRDGNTVAVGAPWEDGTTALRSGRVYVFRKTGAAWAQEAVLAAASQRAYDQLGVSVSLSADGSTLAAGMTGDDGANGMLDDAGAVVVFKRTGTAWAEQETLRARTPAAGDGFGWSVSLSADGTRLAVGAPFEDSDATGVNGAVTNTTRYLSSGAAFVFAASGASWSSPVFFKAPNRGANDLFGQELSLSGDGRTLAVGAPSEDSGAGALAMQNDAALNAGAAYVFREAGAWTFDAYVKASVVTQLSRFGAALALSDDGAVLAAGAPGESGNGVGLTGNPANVGVGASGAVFVFRRGADWAQEAYVKSTNSQEADAFGSAVALSGDGATLAAGAPGEDSDATGVDSPLTNERAADSGGVFVYVHSTAWAFGATVKPSNTGAGDGFGSSVALGGSTLLVASPGEDSSATGVNGDGANDGAMESGAAYAFTR